MSSTERDDGENAVSDRYRDDGPPPWSLRGQARLVERDGQRRVEDRHGNELVVVKRKTSNRSEAFHQPVLPEDAAVGDRVPDAIPVCIEEQPNMDGINWNYRLRRELADDQSCGWSSCQYATADRAGSHDEC